jgi:hypothetical protein
MPTTTKARSRTTIRARFVPYLDPVLGTTGGHDVYIDGITEGQYVTVSASFKLKACLGPLAERLFRVSIKPMPGAVKFMEADRWLCARGLRDVFRVKRIPTTLWFKEVK